MISLLRFSKEHNSIKNVGGVTVLNLCSSSDHALHLNQVSQKYLNGFQKYKWILLPYPNFQRGIILSKMSVGWLFWV